MRIIFTYIALLAFLGQSYAAESKKPLNITITNIERKTYDIKPKKENKFDKMKNVTVNTVIPEDHDAPTNLEEFEIYKHKKIKEEKLNEIRGHQTTIRKINMAKSARRKAFRNGKISKEKLNKENGNAQKAVRTLSSEISKIRKSIKDLDLTIDYLEHPEKYE